MASGPASRSSPVDGGDCAKGTRRDECARKLRLWHLARRAGRHRSTVATSTVATSTVATSTVATAPKERVVMSAEGSIAYGIWSGEYIVTDGRRYRLRQSNACRSEC
ncbi:hypothetical protein RJ55_04698 [Drechmeria coniospora]|nr:hypothetical protein RJ55_04698 [Drechmeria coniospora]